MQVGSAQFVVKMLQYISVGMEHSKNEWSGQDIIGKYITQRDLDNGRRKLLRLSVVGGSYE